MRTALVLALAASAFSVSSLAQQTTGAPAGNFRLMSADGKPVSLSDYKGRMVVLEWNNPGCPFVQKHYGSGNMQRTQARARALGATWLTINSGAPGQQGNMDGAAANAFVTKEKAQPTAYLLDPAGKVGRGYAAKTTPHMYVIAPDGRLAYQGGIDDRPTTDPADITSARNHVLAALEEVKAGKKVSIPETRPYGCAVKYAG